MWSWRGTKFIVTAFHSFSGNFMFWSPFARYSPLLSSKGASWCFFFKFWTDVMWSWNERKFIVTVSNYFSGKNNFRSPLVWFSFFSAKTRIQWFHTELWTRCIPGSKDQHEQPHYIVFTKQCLKKLQSSQELARSGDCCLELDFGEFPRNGDARMARFLANLALESRGIWRDLGTKGILFLQNGFIACIVNLFLESSAHLVSFHRISDFSQEPPVG